MKLSVTSCCGCCNLRTGTLIVGITGIIISLGGIISHTIGLDETKDEDVKSEIKIGIGYSYLYIVIDALLIYGAVKRSRYFLLPWLIYAGIGIGSLTIFCIIFMFFAPELIFGTLLCGLFWYVWICVLCYYNEIIPIIEPSSTIYPNVQQFTNMEQTVVTYTPQPPIYVEQGKWPQVV